MQCMPVFSSYFKIPDDMISQLQSSSLWDLMPHTAMSESDVEEELTYKVKIVISSDHDAYCTTYLVQIRPQFYTEHKKKKSVSWNLSIDSVTNNGCLFRFTATTMDTLWEWRTPLPAWDCAQESSE